MIRFYDLNEISIADILRRDGRDDETVERAVRDIIDRVRAEGDHALLDDARRFDGAELSSLEVTGAELDEAWSGTDPAFIKTLELARDNIARFHAAQRHKDFQLTGADGTVMGQRYTPIARAGLYVPGGTASYPSTVLMTAVPAKIAGVSEIFMVSPPDRTGRIAAPILAAARVAGVTRIFKAGGAGAVAALAYGTESIPRVDKIVGPGNIYVATAKRMVYGAVGIDMMAGPSDILVLADDSANPRWVAADLLGQAEHDALAGAVLITTSRRLADETALELERQLALLPRAEIAGKSLSANGKIILADTLDAAVDAANAVAPEHLELCVEEPFALLGRVRNAGSVFLGHSTPEALGDYLAGPNHTLPTGGTARFASPLSTDDFLKKSSFLCYPRSALSGVKDAVADFARREGLDAHARSVLVRFEE
ncbi:MAG: histidinol dehydrogenase [Clostridia bacterium]|nr:histidinol dehydrogenase [Clostridia bacterium]